MAAGNDILEQIVPALERKDEALDRIAEVLDNILTTQSLTNQQIKSITLLLENRCEAMEIVLVLKSIMGSENRKEQIMEEVAKVMDTFK